jgi:hypothetical protein
MCAQVIGGGPLEALCLSQKSARSGHYTTERMTCEAWKSNQFGAIDSPPNYGEFAVAAYEEAEGTVE